MAMVLNKTKILFLIIITFNICAQNIVYNGDFEIYKKCPDGLSQIEKAIGWYQASDGTSDYFNKCTKSLSISTPKNISGYAIPLSGEAYAGIGLFFEGSTPKYEFVQTKLTQKLKSKSKYYIEFYLYKGNKSTFCFDEFAITLTANKLKIKDWGYIDDSLLVKNVHKSYSINCSNKKEWQKCCFIIETIGLEEYLTIGYNKFHEQPPLNDKIKYRYKEIYYYIDNVSLIEVNENTECKCTQPSIKNNVVKADTSEEIKTYNEAINKSLILSNIVFASKKAELLSSSNIELNKLALYLKQNNFYKIELSGYTDNTGKEDENLKLSQARAKAVADFLINSGINEKRISYIGYGSKLPLKPNTTEENRQLNRRVEFIIKTQ